MTTILLNSSDNVEIKIKLLDEINKFIEGKNWTQSYAAEQLGIDQPKVSQIKNGKIDGFSLERLLTFLKRLDHEIKITITESKVVQPEEERVKHEAKS
ncbi:helix-turn-helix domain-containing protein [Wolbachia endosymbiont of Ctenocephalides felis wCfeT]|uniref:helix-turn-helix domain-containing protein n=1 Tax=Wolbachia endosymbiont of Ctenocephalides felis wCfeT TaxID=2732593 RepID=UPI0014462658|nr:helix-turn-helix transcriptional regulator [Wolbachia endosymbiont of Ctenocephalides felis wCfeT]